ncbi:doublesex- and mab-3-related transcription factor 1-like isoform X2 [Gigantopelta aegis]|uniref:doublesex- and mab-3-related transcription factor 1-like isoform X2 n=1 Tax=Gigantopelta aegis TaxID=1735272 RepID=UPI001B88A3A6|nr:doublesex- and mab-3-related transcription factor 1-like isoform X2 [Gigantopelta aegis]
MATDVKVIKTSRKPPTCAVCRNHGLKIPVRGHKAYCQYINCHCKNCSIIIDSRRASCQKIKLRRRQALEEERKNEKQMAVTPKKDTPEMKPVPENQTIQQYHPNHPTMFTPAPTYYQPPFQSFDYLGYNPQLQNYVQNSQRFLYKRTMDDQTFIPPLIDFSYNNPLVDHNEATAKMDD